MFYVVCTIHICVKCKQIVMLSLSVVISTIELLMQTISYHALSYPM